MMGIRGGRAVARWVVCVCLALGMAAPLPSQIDEGNVIRGIDASVSAREENLLGYTVTEHYSVYRSKDTAHPAAEMTVKTTYRKDKGKSYQVLRESGSELIRKQVLGRVLDSERVATAPANRVTALIDSANYNLHVKGAEVVDGRPCIALTLVPRRAGQYLFQGDLWVDAQDYSIVQLAGATVKSPSVLAGTTQVTRKYAMVDGFPMATHASATSSSWLLGQTVIDISYSGYQIERRAGVAAGSH
ncbi:hypothetical protein DYQ86_00360 [Acidobacteria bacterium AB60]|nr:hypothetical protein DYQ86_00360 [Acidobacteria bacterium AB60]